MSDTTTADKVISDPQLFRELDQPFASVDAFNEALLAFMEEAYELRKKHRITDVHMIVSAQVLDSDGNESARITNAHFGDTERAESMCAWAMGREHAEREERVAGFLAKAAKMVRSRK